MDASQLARVYREEATRIRAALAARLGDVGLAEDAVQDAFIEAIEHWQDGEIPANCGGWLATTARRKAIDRLRRARAGQDKLALLAATTSTTWDGTDTEDDELLGMVFACCHPALPRESQIALTLRAVCGLTTAQIAAAFLVAEPAMTQRLLRARKILRAMHADVRVPDPDHLAERLAEVLAVVYLVFNEGYLASAGRQPARRDLAAQAVTLTRLLHRLMPREPEVLGLLALELLHESRAATRFDGWGRLVRLAEQDRTRWNKELIAEATRLLDQALAMRASGPYQVQAAIAALHAEAPDYEQTDWRQIRMLYDRLQELTPSPVVLLNRAVATRYLQGPQAALAEIEPLATELDGYRLFHALRAGLLTGSAAATRPGKPASGRSRWPSTRPSASSSPAVCRSERRGATSPHGPDLDRHPALVHPGPGLGDLDGLLDGVGLEHRVPAERLLGLHERAVGDAAGAGGLRGGRRRELVTGLDELARTAAALLVPGADLGVPLLALGLGHGPRRLGVQQQDDVLHVCLQCIPRDATMASPHPFHERPGPVSDTAVFRPPPAPSHALSYAFSASASPRSLAASLDSMVKMAS